MTWRGWTALVGAFVAAGAIGFLLVPEEKRTVCFGDPRSVDMSRLRNIAGLLLARAPRGVVPMKDGALDVYAIARSGDISGGNLKILRSELTGTGPTDDAIARGDYTDFPWERYRGDGMLDGPPFPLLWEKSPDEKGGLVVALSDGSARYCERSEVEALFKAR